MPSKPCPSCGVECLSGTPQEPCWGQTECVDEMVTEDDSYWIHACEGHKDQATGQGPYVPRTEGDHMSCVIDGCTAPESSLRPIRTFVHLPGNAAKVKVRFDICEQHGARFFREVEATGKAPGVQRTPPTESEAVNLVRELVNALSDPRQMLGVLLYKRVLRFLKRTTA